MIYYPDKTKIDHRKLKEACECFNSLIKMQENLDKYEKWSMANTIHETAMELAEEIKNKLR
mgnify:CR=1 FL=1|tara:strand:+ start:8971 stop:9153 length:183 start_codon:yes stop_codon:yes gene_type:complete